MATDGRCDGGGATLHTLPSSSDIAYDYACTYCIRTQGSYHAANNYCPDCDVYYCRPCLQYSCDHGSLGKAKLDRWGRSTNRKSGEPCTEHADKMLQLYCGEHDEVGCHICMAERHNHCTSMIYITELVSKQQTKKQMESTKREVTELMTSLTKASKNRAAKTNVLKTAYSNLKKEMQDFRRKMNGLLDDLEKQSMAELDDLKKTLSDQIEDNSQTCDRLEKDVDSLLTKLQQRNVDDTLKFIWLNQRRTTLEKGRKAMSEIADVTDPLSFEFHTEIETCVRSVEGLGDFKRKVRVTKRQTDVPYSVQKTESFNISHSTDISTSSVSGMCQLPDGSFVLSDFRNSCLKQVDASNNLINLCKLQDQPYGVCSTGGQEVAVAYGHIDTVQFVSVGSEMKITKTINMQHMRHCCDLAYNNDKLYVTNWGSSVHVYNRSGELDHTFSFDLILSSNDTITYVRHIDVSPDGKTIYVTNPNKNRLLTIDNKGNVISTFSPPGLELVYDVCVDDSGNVFMCGQKSNNIIQVASKGDRKIAVIVLPSVGIKELNTLCFDMFNSRLLVSCKESDKVYVLDLVQRRQ